MVWAKGDLIDIAHSEQCGIIGFTANSVVMRRTPFTWELTMGAGAALAVKLAYPRIAYKLGEAIAMKSTHSTTTEELKERFIQGVQPDYHVVAHKNEVGIIIAAVQVKRDYRNDGDFDLTVKSLKRFAKAVRHNEGKAVINCPLIGLGGFGDRVDEVKQMVESVLHDYNVIVCVK